jgi:hypothetical protein
VIVAWPTAPLTSNWAVCDPAGTFTDAGTVMSPFDDDRATAVLLAWVAPIVTVSVMALSTVQLSGGASEMLSGLTVSDTGEALLRLKFESPL